MGRLSQRLSVLLVGILAGAFVTQCADAATFSGKPEICSNLATNAHTVGQLRDANVPWETFSSWLKPQLDEAVADPTTYTKSQEDVAYIMGLFKRIYDQPGLKDVALVEWAYNDCMKVQPASFKRKKLAV